MKSLFKIGVSIVIFDPRGLRTPLPHWLKGSDLFCLVLLCAALVVPAPAQSFTKLVDFDSTNGANPSAGLVQATNGDLYGTTYVGGANDNGTIFKITPMGTLTTLYSFCPEIGCTDGSGADTGLIQATDGNFYGTTYFGGANRRGNVFKITPSGRLTTLYSFDGTDGLNPSAPLIQATNGDFYGTTDSGGANSLGTIFKITPGGALTTLHSFCAETGCTDGSVPEAGLVQANNGNFYGTTVGGGTNLDDGGTIFKITPSGTLTTLYSFDGTDGFNPSTVLVQATNGDFYGTTAVGGTNGFHGIVFKITPTGTLTALYSFCAETGCADGSTPEAGLIQATDGNFYGTTSVGGANGQGTVFKITPTGTLTTLYSFCAETGCTDGSTPEAGLIQATNGNLYGTTYYGGIDNAGTIFRLSLGLGPFVETQTGSGKVGSTVKILGNNLTGATSVTFNGASATFTVNSAGSAISATVPALATTGIVEVVTPRATLSSNVAFRVP